MCTVTVCLLKTGNATVVSEYTMAITVREAIHKSHIQKEDEKMVS